MNTIFDNSPNGNITIDGSGSNPNAPIVGRILPGLTPALNDFANGFARVFQQTHIQLRHRVQSKQVQSRHAQMNPLDRPIMESGHAEGAAIANSPA